MRCLHGKSLLSCCLFSDVEGVVMCSFSASNWIADAYGDNGYRYLYAVADAVHARGKSGTYEAEYSNLMTEVKPSILDNAYEFPFFCEYRTVWRRR